MPSRFVTPSSLSSEFPTSFAGTSADEPFRQLLSVKLPEGINSLATGCFQHCTSLQKVEFSGNISIGEAAFFGCSALEEFDFSKVNHISFHAFGDSGLKEADLTVCPEGTVVEKIAFGNASSETATAESVYNMTMTSLKIGKNVTLQDYAFYRMGALTYLYINTPNFTRGFPWRDTGHYSTSLAHKADMTVELGPESSGGGVSAFWCNANVTKVIIDEGVTSIAGMFCLCRYINTIESHCVTPPEIVANTFRVYKEIPIGDFASSRTLYVPSGSEDAYNEGLWKSNVQDANGFTLKTF